MKSPSPACLLWLILSIVCGFSMLFYVARVWSAGQPPQFSDLYAPWWGTHELLLHKRNPYTPAVAHEIQSVIYGAPETTKFRGDPSAIAGGFAYPLYVWVLLAATVKMSFPAAQEFFIGASILAIAASVILWTRLLRLRPSPVGLFTILIFAFGTLPVLEGLWLQNLSLVAAGILFLALFLLAKDRLILAGIVLAISTLKPQFTVMLILWLMIWTVSDWRRRQPLAWSFAASMCALVGSSEWLMPGWITDFRRTVNAYTHYTFGSSLLDLWCPHRVAPFAAAALVLAALTLCWPYRHHAANSPPSFAALSLVLATTLIVIPTLAPHTQVLLLPGFLCLLQPRICPGSRTPHLNLTIFGAWSLLAWPWIAATGITIASFIFSPSALFRWWELPLYTSPVLPLAVAVALGFLIRTWPIHADINAFAK